MADQRISDLSAASTLGGTEKIPVVQSGSNAYATPAQFASFVAADSSTTEATQDVVGAMVAAAGGSYNDAAGTTRFPCVIQLACSDETTALTTGAAKVTFRMPHAMTLTAARASLTTAQGSGSIFTVDLNEGGASVLSTKLTIDNNEKTSTTAATAAVISDADLADDAEITIDIDQVGDGTAKGLKVALIGTRGA